MPDNSVADNTVRINDAVSTRISDKVGWISLTRAKQINAINDDIRMGVPSALRGFDKNPDVSVIVIQGEGERGFCAGADIKEQRGPETSKQIRERMEKTRWVETLDTIGKPPSVTETIARGDSIGSVVNLGSANGTGGGEDSAQGS